MNEFDTVAIVGVGLIGGSVGLALKERNLARRVIGIGRRRSTLRMAKSRGAVDVTSTSLRNGLTAAQTVVICTPVRAVAELVALAAKSCPPEAIITDAASTKAEIVARCAGRSPGRDVEFIGSHPLAGSELSGPGAARGNLFENRKVVITPSARNSPRAIEHISQFWKSIGGDVETMPAARHDRLLAASSHLPHLIASVLAGATPSGVLDYAAGGWCDTTRVAAGQPDLWVEIILSNRSYILKSLDQFGKVLASYRQAIERGDDVRLRKLLQRAKANRDALGNRHPSGD